MVTHRSMKERRMREAARTWRKEGVNWKDEENEAWIYPIPSMEIVIFTCMNGWINGFHVGKYTLHDMDPMGMEK